MKTLPQVVTIAGIDSSGGAGINADVRVLARRQVYSATIVVGLTAQNTTGVSAIEPTSLPFLVAQFEAVFGDLTIGAAKTGALFDQAHVLTVAEQVARFNVPNLVVDPVMIAKGGAALLAADAIEAVRTHLLPLATVTTPNFLEAQALVGYELTNEADVKRAARDLQALGVQHVVIKGGHRLADVAGARDYVLLADGTEFWLEKPFVDTANTHGTGDTFAAFIAAELAKGRAIEPAIRAAKDFVYATIADGIAIGHGHGPLNHWTEAFHDDF